MSRARARRPTATRTALVVALTAGVLLACSGDDDAAVGDTVVTTAAPETTPAPETTAAPEPTSDDGYLFTAPGGDFRVVFPGEPSSEPLSVPLPDGSVIDTTIFLYDTMAGALVVNVSQYPDEYDTSDTRGVLEGSRDGAVENVGGRLESSELITLQGRDGIRFRAQVEAEGFSGEYAAATFIDGQSLYQVGGVAFDPAQIDVDAFIGSFEFTDG